LGLPEIRGDIGGLGRLNGGFVRFNGGIFCGWLNDLFGEKTKSLTEYGQNLTCCEKRLKIV
jgi:hypothetical protein